MPDPIQPPLTTSARRARAGAMVSAETALPTLCAVIVADALDLVSAAVLSAAGVDDPAAARSVLAALWADR